MICTRGTTGGRGKISVPWCGGGGVGYPVLGGLEAVLEVHYTDGIPPVTPSRETSRETPSYVHLMDVKIRGTHVFVSSVGTLVTQIEILSHVWTD